MNFWQEFNERLRALAMALGVHGLMAALVVLGTMNWEPFRKPQNLGLTIEAVIVDTAEIKKQRDAARQAAEMEDRRRQRNEELERQKQRERNRRRMLPKDEKRNWKSNRNATRRIDCKSCGWSASASWKMSG